MSKGTRKTAKTRMFEGFQRLARSVMICTGIFVLCQAATINSTQAQSANPATASNSNWQFEAGLYLFAMGIDGDAGIGYVDAEVDVSFGDILDNLDIGAMGFIGARNQNWSFLADGGYLKVSAEDTFSRSRRNVTLTTNLEVEIEQAFAGAYLGRKVLGGTLDDRAYRIDLLGGARYNKITGELDVQASVLGVTVAANRERSVDWVDPVVGIRGEIWPTKTVKLFGWFDYGGFGVGADSTWQVFAGVSYHPTPTIDLIAGYRVLAFDYEEGSGTSRLKLDLTYSGPMIGIAYKF